MGGPGTLFRVTSGVSALLSGGRHILRATTQVRVLPLMDEGSHSHAASPSTKTVRPTSASEGDSGNGETFVWTGVLSNIYDESTSTSRKVTCTPFLYDSWAYIQGNFATYAGPDPKTVKAKIVHKSSLTVTPQDAKNYATSPASPSPRRTRRTTCGSTMTRRTTSPWTTRAAR
jgi:hypothetical protein